MSVETDFHDLRQNRLHHQTLELHRMHVVVVQILSEAAAQRINASHRHVRVGVVFGSRRIQNDPFGQFGVVALLSDVGL